MIYRFGGWLLEALVGLKSGSPLELRGEEHLLLVETGVSEGDFVVVAVAAVAVLSVCVLISVVFVGAVVAAVVSLRLVRARGAGEGGKDDDQKEQTNPPVRGTRHAAADRFDQSP